MLLGLLQHAAAARCWQTTEEVTLLLVLQPDAVEHVPQPPHLLRPQRCQRPAVAAAEAAAAAAAVCVQQR